MFVFGEQTDRADSKKGPTGAGRQTCPVLILSTPVAIATLELMQARVTVCAGVLMGMPAAMAASRAMFEVKTS